jgi:hypothetical protein
MLAHLRRSAVVLFASAIWAPGGTAADPTPDVLSGAVTVLYRDHPRC